MANTLLATPRKFSMQQCFEILLRKPLDKSIIAYLTDTKTTGLENTMDMTYPTGGRGNVYVGGGFAYNRRATFNVTVATWNTDVLAVQNGTEVYTGSTTVTKYDPIVADAAGNYYTAYTAQGNPGSEIGFVYIVGNDGTYTKTYTQTSLETELSNGQFTYNPTTKQIVFAENDGPLAGEKIVCSYTFNTAPNAQRITISSDAVPPVVLVSAYGVAKDICTGELFPCVIEGQAQVDGNWNFDISADGEPAVQNLSMEFVKGCISNELYTFTVYTEDEDVSPLESITLSVPTGELLGKNMTDLATNLQISNGGVVTGTLKYVTGYTGFSSVASEQTGYYFPFHIDIPSDISDSVVATLQVNNKAPKPLDLNDGNAIVFMGTTEAIGRSKHITVNIDWDGTNGTKYPTETFVFNMNGVNYAPVPKA